MGEAAARAKARDIAGAVARLDKALAGDAEGYPADAREEMMWRRARWLHDLKRWDEAIADLDRLIALAPAASAKYEMERGYDKRGKGDLDGALADFDAARAKNPAKSAQAFQARGEVDGERRDWTAAVSDYGSAARLDPHCGLCYNGRAWALLQLKRPVEALADSDKALNVKPDDPDLLETRAEALEALGRKAEAIADYRRALARAPDNQDAREGLKRLSASP